MNATTSTSKAEAQANAADVNVQAVAPLVRGYEVVIGFETHAQLRTQSKIFSRAPIAFGSEPNTQTSAVDVALPGALPVMNKEAVAHAIRFGLAVGARIAPHSIFARKNYFYPDLPKGYQISQFELPVVEGGNVSFWLDGQKRSVRLVRAHLEEDAGKSLHEDFFTEAGGLLGRKVSGIDLNRAGTPLLEIVTEPDMHSSDEAVEYAKALHTLVVWLGVCDGNMQEGSFRCDANVSIRKPGQMLGTRREIKNLNSFRFLKQAIDFEVLWQIEELEEGRSIEQATVLFNPEIGETRAMRSKEDAADYRYFPDPDLPPLQIGEDWIQQIRDEMPELPERMALRLEQQYAISAYDAVQLTQSRKLVTYFEQACACAESVDGKKNKDSSAKLAKLVANWLLGEFAKRLNAQGLDLVQAPVKPAQLACLVQRIADATISNAAAKQVLDALWTAELGATADVDAIIEAKSLHQMNDSGALTALVEIALQNNPQLVQEFLAGKDKALNALVGQVMKASKGQANPGQVMSLLRARVVPEDQA